MRGRSAEHCQSASCLCNPEFFPVSDDAETESGGRASKPAFKVASFWRGKPERDDRKAVRYAESAAGISNPYRSAV